MKESLPKLENERGVSRPMKNKKSEPDPQGVLSRRGFAGRVAAGAAAVVVGAIAGWPENSDDSATHLEHTSNVGKGPTLDVYDPIMISPDGQPESIPTLTREMFTPAEIHQIMLKVLDCLKSQGNVERYPYPIDTFFTVMDSIESLPPVSDSIPVLRVANEVFPFSADAKVTARIGEREYTWDRAMIGIIKGRAMEHFAECIGFLYEGMCKEYKLNPPDGLSMKKTYEILTGDESKDKKLRDRLVFKREESIRAMFYRLVCILKEEADEDSITPAPVTPIEPKVVPLSGE